MLQLGRSLCCFVLVTSWTLVGCGPGDRPELGQVSGTVTLDGVPLAGALVRFRPAAGRSSAGITDAQGRYGLTYLRDLRGAKIGSHQVTITTYRPAEGAARENEAPTEEIPEKVPAKYNRDTTLAVQVEPGRNTHDFALQTTPQPG